MPQPKRGLGKGLGALIPTGPPSSAGLPGSYGSPAMTAVARDPDERPAITGAYLEEVPVHAIAPNPRQPRLDHGRGPAAASGGKEARAWQVRAHHGRAPLAGEPAGRR